MQNYKESLQYSYFPGSGLVLVDTTKSTNDLVPLQIGLFDSRNYKAIAAGTSYKKVPEVIIAMGSPNPDERVMWTNATHSFKTVPIRADKLISYRKALPKRAVQQKIAIGWDGTTDCKTIEAQWGETYSLFLRIEGSPAARFYGAKPLEERFIYSTSCCTGGEGAPVDVEKLVDSLVTQINSHKYMSSFVKAEKLVAYGTAPTVDTVAYEQFTLTVADNGTLTEFAAIQAAYPDSTVTKVSRDGNFTTYLLVQPTSYSNPADYTIAAGATIPNCSDCPSGYTLVPKFYKFKVARQDAGTAGNLSTIATDYPDGNSNVTPYKLSYVNGESTYVVYNSSASVPAAAATGDIVTVFGSTEPKCILSSSTSTPWVVGDVMFKVKRTLCLVVGDSPCDASCETNLADLQAYYADSKSIVVSDLALADNGSCACSFTVTQLSDNILTEDACYTGIAQFSDPEPYKGFKWTVCPCATETPNDITNIGIVLTGAYVDTKFGKCSFEYSDYVELDLPKIIVTQGEGLDTVGTCGTIWPVTTLQKPQYPTGTGENVKRSYIEAMQFKGQQYFDQPRWQEIFGFDYSFIDTAKFYKFYYLEFEMLDKYNKNTGYGGMDIRTTVVFAFPEEVNTLAFEQLLESWIASARPDLVDGLDTVNLLR